LKTIKNKFDSVSVCEFAGFRVVALEKDSALGAEGLLYLHNLEAWRAAVLYFQGSNAWVYSYPAGANGELIFLTPCDRTTWFCYSPSGARFPVPNTPAVPPHVGEPKAADVGAVLGGAGSSQLVKADVGRAAVRPSMPHGSSSGLSFKLGRGLVKSSFSFSRPPDRGVF